MSWSNNRGGNGTCSGTTTWSKTGITLQSGQNIITVTARDAAGNSGTDTLTVTYNQSAPTQLSNPDYSLLGLNNIIDPEDGPNFSNFALSFDYRDINGDANREAGATLNVEYQFIDGKYYSVDKSDVLIGIDGYSGSILFEQRIRFEVTSGVIVTFTIIDGDGNRSNALPLTIKRPPNAN